MGLAASLCAQTPAESTPPPANPAPNAVVIAPATPPPPSADTIKRAKAVGMHPEVHKGVTVYCWEDATIGTRFTTKKCVGEDQLNDILEQREAQQDKMRRGPGS
jgi:hypothetical protein